MTTTQKDTLTKVMEAARVAGCRFHVGGFAGRFETDAVFVGPPGAVCKALALLGVSRDRRSGVVSLLRDIDGGYLGRLMWPKEEYTRFDGDACATLMNVFVHEPACFA